MAARWWSHRHDERRTLLERLQHLGDGLLDAVANTTVLPVGSVSSASRNCPDGLQ